MMKKHISLTARPSPVHVDRMSEPPSPRSPKTPKILNRHERKGADHLRAQFAEIIDDFQPKEKNVDGLIRYLRQDYEEEDVWTAALTSQFYGQDIPLCECAVRNFAPLIEAFLTRSPLSALGRERVLEAGGQYGQTALQHAIASCNWGSASMLIRHGADVGVEGDSLGIITGLHEAATIQRAERGSWRSVDSKLRDLFSTITSLYGNEWTAVRGQSNRTGGTATSNGTFFTCRDEPVYGLQPETESGGRNHVSEQVKLTDSDMTPTLTDSDMARPLTSPEREHPRSSIAASSDVQLVKKNKKHVEFVKNPFGNPARSSRSKTEQVRRQNSDALCNKYLGFI